MVKSSKSKVKTDVVVEETSNKKFIFIGLGVLVLVVILSAGFYYMKSKNSSKTPVLAAQDKAKKDITDLVNRVGALMELPKNEIPTVATVADKAKLQNQSFFAKAENGDRVLIYTKTKKAILYRPSTNKIIEVTTINIADTNESSTPSATISPTTDAMPEVVIYNATAKTGYANSTEQKLKETLPVNVVKKANTTSDVTKILVVDITGSTGEMATQIAQALGGEVGPLPKSVEKPSADILVILGK